MWKCLKDGMKSGYGNCKWTIGEWREEEEIKLCEKGFHASEYIADAMKYVNPRYICEVETEGKSIEAEDKSVYQKMRIILAYKWEKRDSVELAVYAAELVLHVFEEKYPNDNRPRKAIAEAKKWLTNTYGATAYDAAAHAAAYAATEAAAEAAAYAAAYAAVNINADAASYAANAASYAAYAAYTAATAYDAAVAAATAADAAVTYAVNTVNAVAYAASLSAYAATATAYDAAVAGDAASAVRFSTNVVNAAYIKKQIQNWIVEKMKGEKS